MKRILFLVISVLVVSSILFGSGSQDEPVQPVDSRQEAKEIEEMTFDKPVEIYVQQFGIGQSTWDETIGPEWEKAYPNITVHFEHMTAEDYWMNIKTAYATGTPPDVAFFQGGADVAPYIDFLEPLAPLHEAAYGPDWKNMYYSGVNDIIDMTGEEYYVAPIAWTSTGSYANTIVLDKYGLAIPKNLDDLRTIRDTIGPDGYYAMLVGLKTNWLAFDIFSAIMDDVDPGSLDKATMGEISYESQPFVEGMNIWKTLNEEKIINVGAYGISMYMDGYVEWRVGNGAMTPLGSWDLAAGYTKAAIESGEGYQAGGFAAIDIIDYNGDGKHPKPRLAINIGFSISKGLDKYKKAASWEFLKFFIDGWAQDYNSSSLFFGGPPTVKKIPLSDDLYSTVSADIVDQFKDNVSFMMGEVSKGISGMREPKYAEIKEGLYVALASVATGIQTVEEALADMQTVSDNIDRQ